MKNICIEGLLYTSLHNEIEGLIGEILSIQMLAMVGHGRHRKTRKVANTESQGDFLPTLENYFGSTPLVNSAAMLTF